MDRLPRKPFLVAGDAVNGILYALAGIYLMHREFDYTLYLVFSLLLSTLNTFDRLAYDSLYPNLIPEGCEQKGYAVSGTLYSVVRVVMTPVAAVLFDRLGVAAILLIQSALSLMAAGTESLIRVKETDRRGGEKFSLKMWKKDLGEAFSYLRDDCGLKAIYSYMTVTNGIGSAYTPLVIAFFRTAPGLTSVMYSAFSAAEFIGRALGGVFHYHREIPREKRFSFAFGVYQAYELTDMVYLWLPYPLMLLSRAVVGFLGINSASMRAAAVQRYIPDHLRTKLNAFQEMLISLAVALFSLMMGALGEVMDYRLCVTMFAGVTCAACWLTIWRSRKSVRAIYQLEEAAE